MNKVLLTDNTTTTERNYFYATGINIQYFPLVPLWHKTAMLTVSVISCATLLNASQRWTLSVQITRQISEVYNYFKA